MVHRWVTPNSIERVDQTLRPRIRGADMLSVKLHHTVLIFRRARFAFRFELADIFDVFRGELFQ